MAGEWSFRAGEKGRSRVRVYEKWKGGDLYAEWTEQVTEVDTGKSVRQKRRAKLDTRDREKAKSYARAAAARLELSPVEVLASPSRRRRGPLTMRRLFDEYLEDVTPSKGSFSIRDHDRRAYRVFISFFESMEDERGPERHPNSLDRKDWDRFLLWRRTGKIPGFPAPVKDRQIQYDLSFVISVLNWALGVKEGGTFYLQKNPWGEDVRKAQKWENPRERNPRRVAMTEALRETLLLHSPHWQFSVALVMERYTRRRNNAIRQLRWSDIDLEGRKICWRGETDKAGRANWAPMPIEVYEALQDIPFRDGEAPVFPAVRDPVNPTSRHTFQNWLKKAKSAAGIKIRGLGFHSEKRAGVRDPKFRQLPPAIQEELSGTDYQTLKVVYDEVSFTELEEAQRTLDGGNI